MNPVAENIFSTPADEADMDKHSTASWLKIENIDLCVPQKSKASPTILFRRVVRWLIIL